ncbi:MAG: hypothetical protein HYR88_00430 [Verrucomicrobia bacterium]|nr:hypothetical protein [Verrucomicrobiota bacterium]MBI3871252.1 hypothetical protein [Verrucomicrobiota bacterium]
MTGTPSGNATGTIQCRRNPFLFDQVMRSLPTTAPIAVHLGSGIFFTLGYHEGLSGGGQILNNMRIVGEGIDVTTVTVVAVTAQSQNAYAMGHDLVSPSGTAPNSRDFVEIRDLTLNLDGSGVFPAPTVIDSLSPVGGVRLMGNHTRVVRVKLRMWNNQNSALIGYGISLITANTNALNSLANVAGVSNCGIEECIAIEANTPNTLRFVLFHVGGKEIPGVTPGLGKGCYIRNCFVDGTDFQTNQDFGQLTQGLSMAWCTGGVVEGNQVLNCLFGGPYMEEGSGNTANRGAYGITVRGNTYRNVALGLAWQLGSVGAPNAGVKKLLIEDNTFELATGANIATINVGGLAAGVYAMILDDKAAATAPYQSVIIRGNRIRYLDGAASGSGNGVRVLGATNLQVGENILENMPSNPLKNLRCGSVSYFENKTPAGVLIRGFNEFSTNLYTELETDAEEALVIGFMQS